MRITFQNLKDISDTLSKDDEQFLVDYLNRFDGKNIHEKFLNILKTWEEDVSHTISFSNDEKNMKVNISYVIESFKDVEREDIVLEKDFQITLGIPDKFTNKGVFDLSKTIKNIKYGSSQIKLNDMNDEDRDHFVENLPANVFNTIAKEVLSNQKYTAGFDNDNLKHLKINFLNNSAYMFLKGLFNPYKKDYFLDIIYYLSRKIDGNILLNSTITDIEYYIDKMNIENSENEIPSLA
jgi:hypothetical protein